MQYILRILHVFEHILSFPFDVSDFLFSVFSGVQNLISQLNPLHLLHLLVLLVQSPLVILLPCSDFLKLILFVLNYLCSQEFGLLLPLEVLLEELGGADVSGIDSSQ